MIESAFIKGLVTAVKVGITRHSGELMTVGKGIISKTADTVVAAAPFVAPGVVAGVAGGGIAHAICDDPTDRALTGSVIGGVSGATGGFFTGGPIGAVTNGIVGALTGNFVGHHEF